MIAVTLSSDPSKPIPNPKVWTRYIYYVYIEPCLPKKTYLFPHEVAL